MLTFPFYCFLQSQQSREVLQFHYTHWPDFDLPKTSDSFLDFLFAVRESGSLDISRNGPAVIHCSAGIGRSGTFVLVDSCLVLVIMIAFKGILYSYHLV